MFTAPPRVSELLRARKIDEDAPHQASRHRQKVRAVLPVHPLGVDQPQVGLVDERGRLEGMAAFLSAMQPRAIRWSSSWTIGMSRASADSSPSPQATSSAVTS